MEERIDISKRDLLAAYDEANSDGKALLEKLYGKAIFTRDITERVKTFEDALEVLGEVHCFVSEYNTLVNSGLIHSLSPDLVAYLKLRIITAALNEGWEPQFTVDEYRYYPWFDFYTQKEIDEMDEEDRSRVVGRAGHNANAYGGCVYAFANNASSYSNTSNGARLAFKTRELAIYAGKQFIEIWADFVFRPETKETEE